MSYRILRGEFGVIYPDRIIKTRRKSISLSIEKGGTIIVRAPSKMSDAQINKFVSLKQNWLMSKLSEIKLNQNKFSSIINHSEYLLYGINHNVAIADVKRVEVNQRTILVPNKIEESRRQAALIQFFKKQAKSVLSKRMAYIQSIIKLEPKKVKLTNSKGKWGSCNSHQTIALNWRMIMIPPSCIDYIIIHELCHLVEMNHSARFWKLVETFLPSYGEAREKLKEYSFLLEQYR